MLEVENSLYPPTFCRPPYLQGRDSGSLQGSGWGFGGGTWVACHFDCLVGFASISINKPPPPGANGLTFCRWREEGKRGKSSEGLAAGLYLRVKKGTRNCSEDIKKKIPLKL